ncbi:MAG TPA: 30S ribosomal protein S6 [Gemmataceae bacterium]|nr:30S ribosomal protein S6 [Gemmataceae bacterium]
MPVNVYECMFLLDPTKVAGDLPGAAKQLHAILERNHAEILASRPWDERRLAYPIKGHKKGQYYLTYFRTEGKNLINIERDCALNEMILRQLVLKVDPKLVDIMLQVARDEHALALQSVTAEMPAEGEGGEVRPEVGGEEGGEPPRPRRRRAEAKEEG